LRAARGGFERLDVGPRMNQAPSIRDPARQGQNFRLRPAPSSHA
jgi:hypothetical protein